MSSNQSSHVKELLVTLRDNPADTITASDDVLRDIYLYLMKAVSTPSGEVHWFCGEASAVTIEAATFLIRLMAYDSEEVAKWKTKLHHCLSGCTSCVQGFQRGKVASKHTYVSFPSIEQQRG